MELPEINNKSVMADSFSSRSNPIKGDANIAA
jgi:hypothetical protein